MRHHVQNRISVDFNEMLSPNEVLLSKDDIARDVAGRSITLYEGLRLGVFSDDGTDFDDGTAAVLLADGVVCLNADTGWSSHVKWILRIDERGVRNVPREKSN